MTVVWVVDAYRFAVLASGRADIGAGQIEAVGHRFSIGRVN
jgi:hypothetical protein